MRSSLSNELIMLILIEEDHIHSSSSPPLHSVENNKVSSVSVQLSLQETSKVFIYAVLHENSNFSNWH